jgi:hypothetical protein
MLAIATCVFVVGFATLPGDAEGDAAEARQRWTPPRPTPTLAGYDYDDYEEYEDDYDYAQFIQEREKRWIATEITCGKMDDPCAHTPCCAEYVCTTHPQEMVGGPLKYCESWTESRGWFF